MLTRMLAAFALIPSVIFIIYGGLPLYIAQIVMSTIAINEFYKAFKAKDIHAIEIIGYVFCIYLGIKNNFSLSPDITNIVLFILFLVGITYLLRCKKNIMDFMITYIGIFYVGIFLDYIVLTIDSFELGKIYVWLILIVSFATDTFAYFAGYFFGKHKLIPKVSPKKTIEGSIGGILGSVTCCVIFGYIFKLNITSMVIIGFIGSIIAQMGDLFASSIKRYVNIKDYGKLIPGHGGILDRFDSVILVAPFIYYSVVFLLK